MNLRLSRLLFVGQATLVGEPLSPESSRFSSSPCYAPHSMGRPSQFSRLGVAAITIGAALGGLASGKASLAEPADDRGPRVSMLGAGIVARGDPGGPKAAGTQSADLGSNDDGRHACRGLSRILATLWNRPDLKAG